LGKLTLYNLLILLLARLEGFEPPTYGLEVRCSIHLSYRRFCRKLRILANYITVKN
jgi:hypothetical protein